MNTHARREFLKLAGVGAVGAVAAVAPEMAKKGQAQEPNAARQRQGVFDARDFGATATGQELDTKAIQSAINAAGQSGGTVNLSPGTYASGTLFLKSHVTLHLEPGAVLLGSKNLADYPLIQPTIRSYTDTYVNQSLIYGENLEDVSLMGLGTINGQGAEFKPVHDRGGSYLNRPYLIRLVNCRHVQVADLTLRDSPMWVQHYLACNNVSIKGLSVHSRCNRNNDGIDIDACENVRISDCEIYSGDDAIVLKSSLDRLCRDVTVTNCVISSLTNGLKLGTESVGGFENIVFTNCALYETPGGIALESVDGGTVENVSVSHIVMRDVKSPIFLRLGNRARPPYEGAPKPGLSSFRNITIIDVQAVGANNLGCSITGLPECAIQNITLDHIRIRFQGGGTRADALREVPESPEKYPNYSMFGILPASGFYCRHVKNLKLLNTQVSFESDDSRPALVCDDVAGLRLADFSAAETNPAIVLRETRDAWLESNRASSGNQVYLRLEGPQTKNICIAANDLRACRKPIELSHEVPPDSVRLGPALELFNGK